MKVTLKLICALFLLTAFFVTAGAAGPELVSEAAVLIDADTGQILYDKDMHRQIDKRHNQLPPAHAKFKWQGFIIVFIHQPLAFFCSS